MLAEEYALPVDVVVRSSEAIERWEDVANSVSRRILEEGIVLYERGK
jgi:hypothetical protein